MIGPAGPQIHAGTEAAALSAQHNARRPVSLGDIERFQQSVSQRGIDGVVGVGAVQDKVGDVT